jgi:hypothetical protein
MYWREENVSTCSRRLKVRVIFPLDKTATTEKRLCYYYARVVPRYLLLYSPSTSSCTLRLLKFCEQEIVEDVVMQDETGTTENLESCAAVLFKIQDTRKPLFGRRDDSLTESRIELSPYAGGRGGWHPKVSVRRIRFGRSDFCSVSETMVCMHGRPRYIFILC